MTLRHVDGAVSISEDLFVNVFCIPRGARVQDIRWDKNAHVIEVIYTKTVEVLDGPAK